MRTVLTITILLVLAQFCHAQDFWIELERPTGGMVFSLAVSSKTEVYVGMGSGVYLSNDDSENWEHIGLDDITVYSLHIHPNGNIFAGTGGFNSIYRLNNFEEGWISVFSCVPNIISIASNSQGHIFAGSGSHYGLLRSINNGDDWEQLVTLADTEQTNTILSFEDNQVFIGATDFMGGGGVYRSTDNGDTWEQIGLRNKYIRSLAVNSQGDIFAGSVGDHYLYYGGFYKSTDNGGTWVELRNDVLVTSITITPEDHIYIGCTNEHGDQGGVFRSFDNGETWELINSGLVGWSNQNINGLNLSPDGYLYAYGNHLHRSAKLVFNPNTVPMLPPASVKVYPNPFADELHIELPNEQLMIVPISVKIFDPLGRLVFSQELGGLQDGTINLSSLPLGLYYISVEIRGQRFSKPIVKIL